MIDIDENQLKKLSRINVKKITNEFNKNQIVFLLILLKAYNFLASQNKMLLI